MICGGVSLFYDGDIDVNDKVASLLKTLTIDEKEKNSVVSSQWPVEQAGRPRPHRLVHFTFIKPKIDAPAFIRG